jgi:hypothetical protein
LQKAGYFLATQTASAFHNFAGKSFRMKRHLNMMFRLFCFALFNFIVITGFVLLIPACYTEDRPELSDDKEPKNTPFIKKQIEPTQQKTAQRRVDE